MEDVAFGPMNLGLSIEEVENRVTESLEMVGMSEGRNKSPHHLSGGEKKRVAIAGILAMKPEIIVLDEPTEGLDPQGVNQIMKILNELNQEEGISIIISSHNMEIVTQFADKIFVLHEGEIIKVGTPKEIFNDPETIEKAHLEPPKAAALLYLLKNNGMLCNIKLTVPEAYHEILHAMGNEKYHKLLHLVKNELNHKLLHALGNDGYHKLLHILEEESKTYPLSK